MTNRMEKLAIKYSEIWRNKHPESRHYHHLSEQQQLDLQHVLLEFIEVYEQVTEDEIDTSFIDDNIEVYKRLADR